MLSLRGYSDGDLHELLCLRSHNTHSMTQYQIKLHPDAKATLTNLNSEDRDRITETLQSVASTRKPTAHGKCELLESHTGTKAYKVRVGDYRCVCELSKPEFRILKLGRREKVYSNIDGIYAAL